MYSAASVLVFGLFSCLQERSEGETLRRSTSAEVYDLKKFIEKNKKVWTYQSSDEGKWECKLDHLLNMRDNYASINRSYVMNKTVIFRRERTPCQQQGTSKRNLQQNDSLLSF
uniref:Lipocalin n=1 Tax=Rhipicephalus zambeziensis TaxID=60191 RepID=A0A224YN98_9ACAR